MVHQKAEGCFSVGEVELEDPLDFVDCNNC